MVDPQGKADAHSADEAIERFKALEGKITGEQWEAMGNAWVEEFLPADPHDVERCAEKGWPPGLKSMFYLPGRIFYALARWEVGIIGGEGFRKATEDAPTARIKLEHGVIAIMLAFDVEAEHISDCLHTVSFNVLSKYGEAQTDLYTRFHDCLDEFKVVLHDALTGRSRDVKREYLLTNKYWTTLNAFLMANSKLRKRQPDIQEQLNQVLAKLEEKRPSETPADDAYIPFGKAIDLSNGVLTRKKLEAAIAEGRPVKVRDRKPSKQRREVHIQDVLQLIGNLTVNEGVKEEAARMFGEYVKAYQAKRPKPDLS